MGNWQHLQKNKLHQRMDNVWTIRYFALEGKMSHSKHQVVLYVLLMLYINKSATYMHKYHETITVMHRDIPCWTMSFIIIIMPKWACTCYGWVYLSNGHDDGMVSLTSKLPVRRITNYRKTYTYWPHGSQIIKITISKLRPYVLQCFSELCLILNCKATHHMS